MHELVAAQEVVDHLPKCARSKGDVVGLPFAEAQIALHELRLVEIVEQIHRARELSERPQHPKRVLHEVRRHVTVELEQQLLVEMASHPCLERLQSVAVDGRRHADQISQRPVGMQRRVHH